MRDALGRYLVERVKSIPAEEIAESHEGGYPTVLVVGGQPFLDWAAKSLQDAFPQTMMPRPESAVEPGKDEKLVGKDAGASTGRSNLFCCPHHVSNAPR